MSIFNKQKSIDLGKASKLFEKLIFEGEEIIKAYKTVRDTIVFTSHRVILIDRQGIKGKKAEYLSIPYRSISHFSVEGAGGMFDRDADLKLYMRGDQKIEFSLEKSTDPQEFSSTLSSIMAKI